MNFNNKFRNPIDTELSRRTKDHNRFFILLDIIRWELWRKRRNILLIIPVFNIIYLAAKKLREEIGSPENGVFGRAGIVKANS